MKQQPNKTRAPDCLRVTLEFAGKNWSAFSPDIDGVAAAHKDLQGCIALYLEALEFHLEGLSASEMPSLPDRSRVIVSASIEPEQIGAYRKLHKVSQSDVAAELGISQARVSEIENDPMKISVRQLSDYFQTVTALAGIREPIGLQLAA